MKNPESVAVAILATLLAGCFAGERRIECALEANGRAMARVTGRVPRVTVENSGPGRIRIRFESGGPDDDPALDLSRGRITRSLRGPVRIFIEAHPDGGASVRILARRATGISVEPSP